MGVMVLVLLAVSLIAMFILVPLGAVWGDAALGAIVVMGIMAILGWMANELIKMQEKVGGQREFLKMLEIGAIMILFMLAIAYIVDKILIPIGKQWGPAAAGAIVVMGVMAILGWMADQLIDI